MMIEIPISVGELVDKITILQIKSERMSDEAKLSHVRYELKLLKEKLSEMTDSDGRFDDLAIQLKMVNETLWVVEDDLRDLEHKGQFNEKFIELARSVYITNDRRFALKNEINNLAGSAVREVKSYQDYTAKK